MIEENKVLRQNYESQGNAYQRTIDALETQIREGTVDRESEYFLIKDKYDRLSEEESNTLRSQHRHEIEFLLKEIAQLRASMEAHVSKIDLKDHEVVTIRQSYERELEANATEINTLNKLIMKIEETKNK